jgi:hypothetical protein
MTREVNPNQHNGDRPSPELFSAFVDGELDAAQHAQVAGWLVSHPDAAADVEAYRRLGQAWQRTAPSDPAPAQWDALLSRLQTALPPVGRVALPPRRRLRPFLVLLAAAAALFAGVLVSRQLGIFPYGNDNPENRVVANDGGEASIPSDRDTMDEPFQWASDQDVQIISMDARDTDALLVGAPPIQGDLDLAGHNDITLLSLVSDIRLEDWASPMIIDPLALSSGRDK